MRETARMRTPDDRLTELEIKASYADDLLDQLNHIVARQQQRDQFIANFSSGHGLASVIPRCRDQRLPRTDSRPFTVWSR